MVSLFMVALFIGEARYSVAEGVTERAKLEAKHAEDVKAIKEDWQHAMQEQKEAAQETVRAINELRRAIGFVQLDVSTLCVAVNKGDRTGCYTAGD